MNKTKNLQHAGQCVEMEEKYSTQKVTSSLIAHLYSMLDSPEFDYRWSFVKLMLKAFKLEIISIILLGCSVELISLSNIFLTSFFVDWIKDGDSSVWPGFFYALSIGGLLLSSLVLRQQYFFYGKIIGINVRKAISGMIYK